MTAIEEIRDAINQIRDVRYNVPESLVVRQSLYEDAFWEIWLSALEVGAVKEIGPPKVPDWYLLYGVKIVPLKRTLRL